MQVAQDRRLRNGMPRHANSHQYVSIALIAKDIYALDVGKAPRHICQLFRVFLRLRILHIDTRCEAIENHLAALCRETRHESAQSFHMVELVDETWAYIFLCVVDERWSLLPPGARPITAVISLYSDCVAPLVRIASVCRHWARILYLQGIWRSLYRSVPRLSPSVAASLHTPEREPDLVWYRYAVLRALVGTVNLVNYIKLSAPIDHVKYCPLLLREWWEFIRETEDGAVEPWTQARKKAGGWRRVWGVLDFAYDHSLHGDGRFIREVWESYRRRREAARALRRDLVLHA